MYEYNQHGRWKLSDSKPTLNKRSQGSMKTVKKIDFKHSHGVRLVSNELTTMQGFDLQYYSYTIWTWRGCHPKANSFDIFDMVNFQSVEMNIKFVCSNLVMAWRQLHIKMQKWFRTKLILETIR